MARFLLAVLAASAAAMAASEVRAVEPPPFDAYTFGGIRARPLGPAVTSGRVASLAATSGENPVILVGAASGGLWRSRDDGVTFEPVFDDYPQSVGVVQIDPSDSRKIWVGTGEPWVRNSVSVGRGVFKSEDGGETWKALGLENTERISQILVHPTDSNTAYVCALGHLWDDHPDRGVYRTRDGGATWEKILYVNESTGCADLAMDPQEPELLYAAMWEFRRWPWSFKSGGRNSGLFKSTDGGESWTRLERGLPEGDLGRIAVAVAPSRPSVVYATVEAEQTALYRSEDLGESWIQMSTSFAVQARPFYFSRLVVDPSDHNRVYKPGFSLAVSTDGGRSFTSPLASFGGSVHPDHHALWVDPEDPKHLLLGTDGGVYISRDRGVHWRFVHSLPIAQFYHASFDLDAPANVMGGLQDNGSWMAPVMAPGGVRGRHWRNIGYGDGFYAFRDRVDPRFVYTGYQGGNLLRVHLPTGEIKDIKPYPGPGEPEYRFNWNAAVHLSEAEPGTLYLGAQYIFRSRDRGESWERISPDLTTNDPRKLHQERSGGLTVDNSTAENHCSIVVIEDSPLRASLLWAGTDDGNLQVSTDAGTSWTNVIGAVPNLPSNTWVSSVDASPHEPETAFVTFDGHRTGDMRTYVYRTRDLGATWEALPTGGVEGYAHVIRQDPVNPAILYLGTEFGLYLSLDEGSHWARFRENLPPVAVRDLAIHPETHDLLIASHGRGLYVIEDLTPIRALSREVLETDVSLLPSRPAIQWIPVQEQEFGGNGEFVSPSPPEAAAIHYYLKKRHVFGDLKVEVYDSDGGKLATLAGGKRRGINRVFWPMRLPAPEVPPASNLIPAFQGPAVPEGTYRVRLVKGDQEIWGEVQVRADPRSPHSPEDRALQHQTAMRLYRLLEGLTYVVDSLMAIRDGADERLQVEELDRRTRSQLEELRNASETLRRRLVASGEGGLLSGEEKLREKLGGLYGSVVGYSGRPSPSQLARVETLALDVEAAFREFDALRAEPLKAVNARLTGRGLEGIRLPDEAEWKEERSNR